MDIHKAIAGLPIIYETAKIEFYWNESDKILISYAKAFSDEEEYRMNMQACVDLCMAHKIRYIIFESVNFKGTSPNNQKWVVEHIIPAFKSNGILAITLVMAKDIFGKFSLNNMAKDSPLAYGGILPFQFTDDFADAYEWIMDQKSAFEQIID